MSFLVEHPLSEIEAIIKISDSYVKHNEDDFDLICLNFLSDNLILKRNDPNNSLLKKNEDLKKFPNLPGCC